MKASLHTWMTMMARKASGAVTSMHKPLYFNDCYMWHSLHSS